VASALVAAAPASAANPAPCNGVPLTTDDAGDQFFEPTGLASFNSNFNKLGHKASDSTDIVSAFFTYDAARQALYANLKLTDATLTLPLPTDAPTGVSYYFIYYWGGQTMFVRATNEDGSGLTYAYGTVDSSQGTYSTVGSARGSLFPGHNGVIQIQVPARAGGKLGEVLGSAVAASFYNQGTFINTVDTAPDGADTVDPDGYDYTVKTCV
jgi:hypothetical protein